MKNIIRNLVVLCLMLMLIACGDSDSKNKSDSQKGYDYHDERNQDFYSRYMRKTGKDYFIAEPKKIREKLKLGEIPDSALARINLTRVERSEKRNFLVNNNISNKNELLIFYNQNEIKYQPCTEEYKEDNLFCLSDLQSPNSSFIYFYIPNDSIKLKNINQIITFFCYKNPNEKNCTMFHSLNPPISVDLSVHFTDPQNFFYLIPYIEQHFYETTGEHVWQTLPKKN